MSDKSKIEWTDATWNPIRGCSHVSEGCRNCYAERIAARFAGPGQPYEGVAFPSGGRSVDVKIESLANGGRSQGWTGEIHFEEKLLDQPLRWKRPRKIFVNSMSDLFHDKVPTQRIGDIVNVMAKCERHTFQVLTKRPERMRVLANLWWGGTGRLDVGPPHNIWLGVSVEDQKTADERIPLLLQTPAAVRWVSYEPALGPVDFTYGLSQCHNFTPYQGDYCATLVTSGLDWIVAGGESGPGARPADPNWFRSVRNQCHSARVPFFFKQWGEWLHALQMNHAFTDPELDRISFKTICRDAGNGDLFIRVGKKRAGHLLDGTAWQEFPPVRG